MGHLNGILAQAGGNLNNNFPKRQIPGGLPGGGMLKLRFDRYIMSSLDQSYFKKVNVLITLEVKRADIMSGHLGI